MVPDAMKQTLIMLGLAVLWVDCSSEKTPPQATTRDRPSAPAQMQSSAKQTALEQITSKTGTKMVLVPAGAFTMGDADGEEDEKPSHAVRVRPFYMDVYEVTQRSYETLMGQNPSKFKNPENPVEQVGWYGAIKYCNMRALREGLTPCYDLQTLACDFSADGYRLPTEAEWEYACRAQTTAAYSFGGSAALLGRYAWYDANANKSSHPAGQKTPNPWGLFDMHGNVWEWCQDVYNDTYYGESPESDPCNGAPGDERVLRGGGWDSPAEDCRSASRYGEEPGLADVCFGYDAYGFRCVRGVPNEAAAAEGGS